MIITNMWASSHEVHSREAGHVKGKAQPLACVAVKHSSKVKASSRPTFPETTPTPTGRKCLLQAGIRGLQGREPNKCDCDLKLIVYCKSKLACLRGCMRACVCVCMHVCVISLEFKLMTEYEQAGKTSVTKIKN